MAFDIHVKGVDTPFPLSRGDCLTEIDFDEPGLIPFSCRAGVCSSCVISVLEGVKNVARKEPLENNFLEKLGFCGPEYRLACQCIVKGPITLEIISG